MIILGSQSKYRKGVLEELGFEFETMSADIDEKSIRDSDPKQLVLKLGRAKNDALKNKIGPEDILITSDQITIYNGEIREKPTSREEAYKFLKSYSNSNLATYTSLVVFNNANGKQVEGIDIVPVYFNEIPESDIQTLIHQDNILHIGGGFLIEDPILLQHVKKIDGDIKSVMAMPPKLLKKLLEEVKE
jgi:septum formation protein